MTENENTFYEKDNYDLEDYDENFDALIDCYCEQAEFEDDISAVANLPRVKVLLFVYKVLQHYMHGKSAKVSYKLNEPYKSMGSVSVVGRNLTFNGEKWLLPLTQLASNFNVYPKTDGTVQMDFTFHGLTVPME